MGRPSCDQLENNLPVFVFPNTIFFYFNEPKSLKRILTLYNPYDFTIKFKVLSTSPRKYNVIEPEGSIRPRSCLDITIRLVDSSIANLLKEDQFRIEMRREDRLHLNGKRDISAVMLAKKEDKSKEEKEKELFEQLISQGEISSSLKPSKMKKMDDSTDSVSTTGRLDKSEDSKTHLFYIIAAIICGIILCLPSGEKDSQILQYLHVAPTLKIVVAYILGLITCIICKYN